MGTLSVQTVSTGAYPVAAVLDSGNGYVYIVNQLSGNVSVLNGSSVVGTIGVGSYPWGAAYDSGNGLVYVVNNQANNVSVINGTSLWTSVSVGQYPTSATYDPTNGYVYVTNGMDDTVSVINGTRVIATFSEGLYPFAGVYDAQDGYVYITNEATNNVGVIDGTSLLATLTVGTHPVYPTYDSGSGDVYVPNIGNQSLNVIHGTKVSWMKLGDDSWSAAYDSENGWVYVVHPTSATVSVINGTTSVGTIRLWHGCTPRAIAFDEKTGYLFVANENGNNVSVLNGTSYLGAVGVGNDSSSASALYDNQTGDVYVTNYLSSNVSVIAPGYNLTVTESGLPTGTPWWVNVTGVGPSTYSNTTSMTFGVPNGTYLYTATTTDKSYFSNGGRFTIDGGSIVLRAPFGLVPVLQLGISVAPPAICLANSTQCPAGTWIAHVTLWATATGNSSQMVAEGTNHPLFQFVPYGNISLVPGQSIQGHCILWSGGRSPNCPGNSSVQTGASLTVLGWNWSSNATSNVMVGGDNWSVTFEVRATGPPFLDVPVDACVTVSCRIAGSQDVGGYYSGANYFTPADGTFKNLSFSLGQVQVQSNWTLYTISLDEVGLPAGTNWTATLGGASRASAASTINFTEPNGTYNFSVTASKGNYSSSSSTVSVNGQDVQVEVTFAENATTRQPLWANQTHSPPSYSAACKSSPWTVGFFSNATGGSPPYSFTWSFGDGTPPVDSRNATHTFAVWGVFNVTLSVGDSSGAHAKANATVEPMPPPCASETPSGPTPPYLEVGLGVVGALAIAVVVILIRRRGK